MVKDPNTNQIENLAKSVATVLEEMAFSICEPLSVFPYQDTLVCFEMNFIGNENGIITLCTSYAGASSLACSILGKEEVNISESESALCEVVNVVTGQYVTKQYGVDCIVDLSVPRKVDVHLFSEFIVVKGAPDLIIDVDGFALAVWLRYLNH